MKSWRPKEISKEVQQMRLQIPDQMMILLKDAFLLQSHYMSVVERDGCSVAAVFDAAVSGGCLFHAESGQRRYHCYCFPRLG